jgi:hypothetical protein
MDFSQMRKKPILEFFLFLMALLWALFLSFKLQATADQGMNRWQADAKWLYSSDENPFSSLPSFSNLLFFQNKSTTPDTLDARQTEIDARLSTWTELFQADIELLSQSSFASEKEMAAAAKRLKLWEQWQQSVLSQQANMDETSKSILLGQAEPELLILVSCLNLQKSIDHQLERPNLP